MFGLSIEKLVLVAVIAALLLGPERLPVVTQRVGEFIRGLRGFVETSRARLEEEAGVTRADWEALDPRRYDPRRIVREALEAGAEPAGAEPDAAPAVPAEPPRVLATPSPRMAGSSGHPRRLFASPAPVASDATGEPAEITSPQSA
ncbi:MAG: preprotein translocase [Leifsonia xyli]|nr:MAG: preprotein translocase [Leifsonia xyli]